MLDAGSADDVPLDDRDLHAGTREPRGHIWSGLAGADDDRVVVRHFGSSLPDCSATMYAAYQSGQFASLPLPIRVSYLPWAVSAR